VNLHSDAADALLRRFAFIPYARLDDVMVSYAAPGGGVGPHVDSYDVFLLQGSGRRRWRYGRQDDLSIRRNLPLKILQRFEPTHDATLAPGDMLYLPPHIAHDGTAVDECMTYSIGFRAPLYQEVVEAFIDHLRDSVVVDGRYADPELRATARPGRIDAALQRKLAGAIAQWRFDKKEIARFIGCFLTEPKPDVVFAAPARPSRQRFASRGEASGLRLDRRTQLLYDDERYYLNGDDAVLADAHRVAVQRLSDHRMLSQSDCAALSPATLDLLYDWYRHGYLRHP
jgi:50S ribosomal protein L16 3-hydroxylase